MSFGRTFRYRPQFTCVFSLALVSWVMFSATVALFGASKASAATPGFVEEFDADNGGFDFGVGSTRIATGGITGSGDSFIEVSRATSGNLVSRCSAVTAPELVGNLPSDGVTGYSFYLRDTGTQQTALRIRVFFGVANINIWTSNADFNPTSGWTQFSVDTTSAANWTQIVGTGTFANAVTNADFIGFRHDPAPVGQTPDPIIGEFGVDRLTVLPGISAVCGNGDVESGEQCDDDNTTGGDCCSATCQFESFGSGCSDNNLCTSPDTCNGAGSCTPGSAVNPNDGIPCTVDACVPASGVTNTPNDAACADGNLCNGVETCSAVIGCEQGSPIDSNDRIGCTDDSCNPMTGAVSNIPNDSLCTDNDVCTGVETCDAINDCQPGTPLVTNDGVGCTDDSCDAVSGVANVPNDSLCTDNDVCTGAETCDAINDCQPGTPLVTNDGVGCTDDSCDAISGVANVPNDSLCTDNDVCTGVETCDAVNDCQSGTPLVTDDGVGCTDDSCDAISGVANVPNDSLCTDNDVCTGDETCDAINDCQSGTPIVIDDGVACTDDSCNPSTGDVTNDPNSANCDNGVACDGAETCDAINDCQSGTPLVAVADEDFEAYTTQLDATGVMAMGETFYRVLDSADAVATVIAASSGSTGIADVGGNLVWTVESLSSGIFVAEAAIPPNVDAGLTDTGDLGTYFSVPQDLGTPNALVCADVQSVGGGRDVRMQLVLGDSGGNYAASNLTGALPSSFETFEFEVGVDNLTLLDGAPSIDLTQIDSLEFRFGTLSGASETFQLEIDNVRVVPEPDAITLALATVACLAALRSGRRIRG